VSNFLQRLAIRLPFLHKWIKGKPDEKGSLQSTPTASVPQDMSRNILTAQHRLKQLKEKSLILAGKFATSRIDRSQFDNEYRLCQEEILNLEYAVAQDFSESTGSVSNAWSQNPLLGLYIYDRQSGTVWISRGNVEVDHNLVLAYRQVSRPKGREAHAPERQPVQLKNGRWMYLTSGEHSQAVSVFNRQPSSAQLMKLDEIQQIFERANAYLMQEVPVNPETLVCPFEVFFSKS